MLTIKKYFAVALACCLLALSPVALGESPEKLTFGPFSAEDLNGGGTLNEEVFASAKITLVNFWATWCGPCVAELPDLAALWDATDGQVQVLSVLTDGLDYNDNRDESAIEAMHALAEDANVKYPVLLPDEFLGAIGNMLQAIPTTFIVDETGAVRGDVITGSRDMQAWLEIAQAVADEVYGDDVILAKE